MKYVKPLAIFIPINLDEGIACSKKHMEDYILYPMEQNENMPSEETSSDESSDIELSLEDGEFNRDLLNSFLAKGNVHLKLGIYPMAPGLIIDGVTLDMNGSEFISTEARFSGGLIKMTGNSPALLNGRLSGLYSVARGEPGYTEWKQESAVRLPIGGYSDAKILGCTFDHWHGYAVCTDGSVDDDYCIRHFGPKKPDEPNRCIFLLTGDAEKFRYISARHAVEYNYFISDRTIVYEFYDKDGGFISSDSGIPGQTIEKPKGSAKVIVTTYLGEYKRYGLFEYAYDNSVRIENCYFWCNARLGIANLGGYSEVISCISESNGYPCIEHAGMTRDSSTSGFMDIEDIQTPILVVSNCVSKNENLGIASRAYMMDVSNCNCSIVVYGGWRVNVSDHNGRVCCNTETVMTDISVQNSYMKNMWMAKIGPNMHILNCTLELCDALNYLPGFEAIVDANTQAVPVNFNGIVKGRVTGDHDVTLKLATKPGSDLRIELPADGLFGIRAADDDCFGIRSNALILPNGRTLTECVFLMTDDRYYRMYVPELVSTAFSGIYSDCVFANTAADVIFKAPAAWMGNPIKVIFENCRFILDGAFLYDEKLKEGSEIEFIGCTIDGKPIDEAEAKLLVSRDTSKVHIIVKK